VEALPVTVPSFWNLLVDAPRPGLENMAADEALWRGLSAHPHAPSFLRLYAWDPPAFSLGVSQEDPSRYLDLAACRRAGVQVVRRMTGGGVLFHGRELTYSMGVPDSVCGPSRRAVSAYKHLCGFLLTFYRRLGLQPCFADEAGESALRTELCFAGREKYDILVRGKKIGGNAQKRGRGYIFQHGSIPLSLDRELICRCVKGCPREMLVRATALDELLATVPAQEMLRTLLLDSCAETLGVELTPYHA
jgi:lipoyl(octanoyl) transferase